MDVPEARRLERPTWVNSRTVFGLLLFVASFAGGRQLLVRSETTSPVWVAARNLTPGTQIGTGDLRIVELDLPSSVGGSYAGAEVDLTAAVLSQPVLEGQLIPMAWTNPHQPTEGRLMSVPLAAEHAVGGALAPGDVVDIYATFKGAKGDARTVLLAASVSVVDTISSSDLIGSSAVMGGITVSVSEEEAPRIAFALRTADLDVVQVMGASAADPNEVVTGEDL